MKPNNTLRRAIAWWGALVLLGASALLQRSTAARAQISKSASDDLATGRSLYDQKCEPCHFSTSSEKKIGPGLAGLMKRAKFKDGLPANDASLRRVIERGGKDMPGFRDSLKERQVRELIAYVNTL
ncbi:MAG TPA: cytochrome c [Candidatus Acidoferrales bacterium]|nr:cytochrome c [Candidatus Acidoferrales bacterium]